MTLKAVVWMFILMHKVGTYTPCIFVSQFMIFMCVWQIDARLQQPWKISN